MFPNDIDLYWKDLKAVVLSILSLNLFDSSLE